MASPIYVFGHKNPDTDSICSAIAYAELKKATGIENVEAYRLGKINRETEYVLEYFGVESPPLLEDIKLRLRDLDLYNPARLFAGDPLKKAWDILNKSHGSRLIPIVDANGKLEGLMSQGDITKIFINVYDEDLCKHYEVLFANLLSILNGNLVIGYYPYKRIEGSIYIGVAVPEYEKITDKDVLITENLDIAVTIAKETSIGCIILTNGLGPYGLEAARCAVVCVDCSMFKAINLVNHAISIGSILEDEQIVGFSSDSLIEDIIDVMKISAHRNFPVMDRKGQLEGVISRRHLIEYKRKQVILIDHNERNQSIEGLDMANILEIIDHHRVADIQTTGPLYIRSEPVGCTATIIYKMYMEQNIPIPAKIAGILLGAILSDTLMFNSPTCITDDRAAAERLAELAGVDHEEFGREMFSASTSLEGYSPEEILDIDIKQFSIGQYLVCISQVNTLDFHSITNNEEALLSAMKKFHEESGCDLVILMITDIIKKGSQLIVTGKARELAIRAFDMQVEDRSIFLPGVVSRKKQIVPKLTMATQMV